MVKIFDNFDELIRFAAEKFSSLVAEAVGDHGFFAVALAGGSTPKAFFRLLAGGEFAAKIDWEKVFFFFGDERSVPPDDDESNYKTAHDNLFAPLEIAAQNVFRWRTELDDPSAAAADYAHTVAKFFAGRESGTAITAGAPRFDLILLGMGDDGHTASLFPFTPALNETEKLAVANPVEKLDTVRLTLTFTVINQARNVIFLVKGADKAAALKEVLEGAPQPAKFPSQTVKPADGELWWLVDRAAAADLAPRIQ